jgi:hypothetical protein
MKSLTPVIYFDDVLPNQKSDIAICVIGANDIAMKQLDVTRSNIINYASFCGADYIELNGDLSPDWPMSNKYRLKQVIEKYEHTLYLDCDIVVKDGSPNVFDVFSKDKISLVNEWQILKNSYHYTLFKSLCYERFLILEDYPHLYKNNRNIQPNNGMMFFPKKLADKYSQPENPYYKMWCFDQDYLILNLEEDDFELVDWRYNLEFIDFEFWSKIPHAYFVHLNGSRPIDYRVELLKRITDGNYEYFPQPPAKESDCNQDAFRPFWRETC